MIKKVTTSKNCSYEKSVSYNRDMSYHARLKNAKATDLRNNDEIIDLENGFSKVIPHNKNKKFKS